MAEYPLRPRYGSLAAAAGGLGVVLIVVGALFASGAGRGFALGCGGLGVMLALAWWRSPVRKLVLRTSERGISVWRGERPKLELGWDEVERLLLSDGSAYLWAGELERSLLIAGPGVPAPYAVENREALLETIAARVAPDRIERTGDLVTAYRELQATSAREHP